MGIPRETIAAFKQLKTNEKEVEDLLSTQKTSIEATEGVFQSGVESFNVRVDRLIAEQNLDESDLDQMYEFAKTRITSSNQEMKRLDGYDPSSKISVLKERDILNTTYSRIDKTTRYVFFNSALTVSERNIGKSRFDIPLNLGMFKWTISSFANTLIPIEFKLHYKHDVALFDKNLVPSPVERSIDCFILIDARNPGSVSANMAYERDGEVFDINEKYGPEFTIMIDVNGTDLIIYVGLTKPFSFAFYTKDGNEAMASIDVFPSVAHTIFCEASIEFRETSRFFPSYGEFGIRLTEPTYDIVKKIDSLPPGIFSYSDFPSTENFANLKTPTYRKTLRSSFAPNYNEEEFLRDNEFRRLGISGSQIITAVMDSDGTLFLGGLFGLMILDGELNVIDRLTSENGIDICFNIYLYKDSIYFMTSPGIFQFALNTYHAPSVLFKYDRTTKTITNIRSILLTSFTGVTLSGLNMWDAFHTCSFFCPILATSSYDGVTSVSVSSLSTDYYRFQKLLATFSYEERTYFFPGGNIFDPNQPNGLLLMEPSMVSGNPVWFRTKEKIYKYDGTFVTVAERNNLAAGFVSLFTPGSGAQFFIEPSEYIIYSVPPDNVVIKPISGGSRRVPHDNSYSIGNMLRIGHTYDGYYYFFYDGSKHIRRIPVHLTTVEKYATSSTIEASLAELFVTIASQTNELLIDSTVWDDILRAWKGILRISISRSTNYSRTLSDKDGFQELVLVGSFYPSKTRIKFVGSVKLHTFVTQELIRKSPSIIQPTNLDDTDVGFIRNHSLETMQSVQLNNSYNGVKSIREVTAGEKLFIADILPNPINDVYTEASFTPLTILSSSPRVTSELGLKTLDASEEDF